MNIRHHLSFANIASATALVLVLGGGVAVAAGLAPNSVGSEQIRNNSVTGKDVKESTLGTVPSVDSVAVSKRVRVGRGQGSATVHRSGPFTVTLRCEFISQRLNPNAYLEISTSADNSAVIAQSTSGGTNDQDFDVSEGTREIGEAGESGLVDVEFTAVTPAGEMVSGEGYVATRFNGSRVCSAQLILVG